MDFIRLANPNALWLLLLLPVFIYVGYPRSQMRRRRSLWSLAIRLLLVLLIILSLAGAQIQRESNELAVVFLVDASDSMRGRTEEAIDYVEDALEEMNVDRDRAAVVLFGADAVVEHPMAATVRLEQIGANPITLQTDLSEAMRLALALFPPDSAKRIVILSDGVETVGDAESAARLAAATSVQIDYVPFERESAQGELILQEVVVPQHVNEEEIFDLVVTVRSDIATSATLRVLASGAVLHEDTVNLQPGENRFSIGPLNLPGTGFADFYVQIEPLGDDVFYENNRLAAFTEVQGRPQILLVASDEREIEFLRPALEESGLVIDIVEPRDLPGGLAALSSYSSIVLVNVSATELMPVQMELLQLYVRDLGGGLVAIGGPNSFGVGGYFETPLEETLPVDMRIRDQQRIPSLTMLFVIDRSGSMEMVSNASGYTNLELAKEAIIRSFNLLNDYDRTGVISFDTEAYYVLELQEVGNQGNRQAMTDDVASLRPGGGTDIFGALSEASRVLPNDPSTLKHIILLTDGGASYDGIPALAADLQGNGVTISVVAVGQGYADWLKDLAQRGGGNFHEAMDVANIPSIFAAETVLATRSYIMEEEFSPSLTARSPIMTGIDALPSLQGYIASTEKDTATVVLRGPEDDPILAQWQYGLGRAVAFTSDATSRWAQNWVSWEEYSRFWSQAVRWTITEGSDNHLEVTVEQRGEQAYLVVDARDEEGEFLNGLNLDAAIINPENERELIKIEQIAPGRYEATFTPDQEGAYFLSVAGANVDEAVSQTTGWVLSYSPEYLLPQANTRFLARLAEITRGGSLEGNPTAAFDHDLNIVKTYSPIWQYLLVLSAFLLLLDIAVRRLVINRTDLERAQAYLQRRFFPSSVATETSGRLTDLMTAKRRVSTVSETDKAEPTAPPAPSTPARRPAAASSVETPPRPQPRRTPEIEKRPTRKTAEGGSLASRLLEKKKDQD